MGAILGSATEAMSPIAQAATQPAPAGSIMGTPEPTGASYGKGGPAANNQPLSPGATPNPTMGFGKLGSALPAEVGQAVNNMIGSIDPIINDAANTPTADTGGFNYPTLPGYNPVVGGFMNPAQTQNPLIQKGVMPQTPAPAGLNQKYGNVPFSTPQQRMPGPRATPPRATPPRATPPQRVAPGRMPGRSSGRITY